MFCSSEHGRVLWLCCIGAVRQPSFFPDSDAATAFCRKKMKQVPGGLHLGRLDGLGRVHLREAGDAVAEDRGRGVRLPEYAAAGGEGGLGARRGERPREAGNSGRRVRVLLISQCKGAAPLCGRAQQSALALRELPPEVKAIRASGLRRRRRRASWRRPGTSAWKPHHAAAFG